MIYIKLIKLSLGLLRVRCVILYRLVFAREGEREVIVTRERERDRRTSSLVVEAEHVNISLFSYFSAASSFSRFFWDYTKFAIVLRENKISKCLIILGGYNNSSFTYEICIRFTYD